MKTYFGLRKLEGVQIRVTDGKSTRLLEIGPSQKIFNHSNAYEVGYGGSGPSQTALAILLDYLGNADEALKLYQDFKWRFVSGWEDNWQITGKEIGAWLLEVRQGGKGFTGSPKAPVSSSMNKTVVPPKRPIQG